METVILVSGLDTRRAIIQLTFCSVKAIITAQGDACANKHLPVVETQTVATNIHSYCEKGLTLKHQWAICSSRRLTSSFCSKLSRSSSQDAKGSRRSKTGLEEWYVSPPWEKFPARAIHTPPFRTCGMTGNRLFNRAPPTKVAETQLWTVGSTWAL